MSAVATRVMGIDTSLRCTGLGVVEVRDGRLRAVDSGCLKTRPAWRHSVCLVHIADGIRRMIADAGPDSVAIEGAFFCKNVKTAMVLGEARGVAIAVCAEAGLPVYEYAPRQVKQAVTGVGGAEKHQVMKMVVRLLGLDAEVQQDAADALALAICHVQRASGISGRQEPI